MSAEKIVMHLLTNSAPLQAVVPAARIYPSTIPLGAVLPAIGMRSISERPRNTLGTREANVRSRSRIEVSVNCKTYPQQKALIALVRSACKYRFGTVAGVASVTVLPDGDGPDLINDDATVYMQSTDLIVSFNQANA